jgi:hypothetical protein
LPLSSFQALIIILLFAWFLFWNENVTSRQTPVSTLGGFGDPTLNQLVTILEGNLNTADAFLQRTRNMCNSRLMPTPSLPLVFNTLYQNILETNNAIRLSSNVPTAEFNLVSNIQNRTVNTLNQLNDINTVIRTQGLSAICNIL